MTKAKTAQRKLQRLTVHETLGVARDVLLPTLAKGPIIRRPAMVSTAERFELDTRAVRRMQMLRNKYGSGPLLLRLPPGRTQAIITAPEHVHRVLSESPEPFSPASSEKRAALTHFEPEGVLISKGSDRADRRQYNDRVLDSGHPHHRMAEGFVRVVRDEAGAMISGAGRAGELGWSLFSDGWFRVVRRIVFGDGARDDHELTRLINSLRSDGNWAFLRPKRREVREQFYERLGEYVARAEPGSLAQVMANTPVSARTVPEQQVPQWLFAFDPAGMTIFRALALLASHSEQAFRAEEEIRAAKGANPSLPYLRACVLESLRLWPTTPMVLRQSTQDTLWETGVMPAQTGILIYAPFFHRDDERLPYADDFVPEIWLKERGTDTWPLIPFSGGPVVCPGRNLVLLLASAMLAALLGGRQVQLEPVTRLTAGRPLPGTLNPYTLNFSLATSAKSR